MENESRDAALQPLRKEIDRIDAQLLDLINQRLSVGIRVGEVKREKGNQILDRKRERAVIENLLGLNRGPATRELLQYIFNVIITATREIQKPKTVSFLGPASGFTHVAALNHFKHSGRFLSQPSLVDIFREVDRQESHYGVVPVENSIEGAVNHTLDLFIDFDLKIVGEHYEPVSHDLLSVTGDPDLVKIIFSHPQAIAQCKGWLTRKFPGTDVREVPSSAEAARMAVENPDSAAIGSGKAAHIHELLPVETGIQDHTGNITRFLVIGKEDAQKTGDDRTSVMFATSHVPGALFKALAPVEKAGLNMLKLESRPTRHQNWSYYFFLDMAGHRDDPDVADTIEQVRAQVLSLKVLGSYPVYVREEI